MTYSWLVAQVQAGRWLMDFSAAELEGWDRWLDSVPVDIPEPLAIRFGREAITQALRWPGQNLDLPRVVPGSIHWSHFTSDLRVVYRIYLSCVEVVGADQALPREIGWTWSATVGRRTMALDFPGLPNAWK